MNTKMAGLNHFGFYQNFKNLFFYTSFFPIFTGTIAFLCWLNNITLLGLAIFVLIACYLFVSQEDMLPIVPMLFFVIIMFRSLSTASTLAMYIILAPAVVCVLIHVFKYRYKPNLGKLFFPMVAVSVALFSGGLFTYYLSDYMRGLATMISVGPGLIIVYLFFLNYIHPPKHVSLKIYFSKCVIFMAFFTCLQAVILLYNQHVLDNTIFVKNELGWANVNNVGTIILMAVPLCFYLMVKTEKVALWLIAFLILFAFACIINSSAVIFVLILIVPFLIFYTYYKIPDKSKVLYKTTLFTICALGIGYVLSILATDYTVITNFMQNALNGNGREMLYDEALKLINKHPLFGVGLGYYNDEFYFMFNDFKLSNLRVYNFHSTFLHVFATMGIVGMVAYVYYFIQRIRVFTIKQSRYSKFAFVSFMAFSFHGMFDTCEFNMIPLLIVLTLIMVVAEVDAKRPPCQENLFKPILT